MQINLLNLIFYFLSFTIFALLVELVYFLLNLSIRILGTFTRLPFNNISHVDELARANMISTLASPLFYFAAVALIRYYEHNRTVKLLSYALVVLFSLFVITNGMRVTFFAMHNPRNRVF